MTTRWTQAFDRFASRNAIVPGDEGKRHEVGYFRHGSAGPSRNQSLDLTLFMAF
jgi:hypothetical protein